MQADWNKHPPLAEGAFMLGKRINQKTAWVFANGMLEEPEALRPYIHTGDYITAADAGARHVERLGLRLELLVGDLDSISQQELHYWQNSGCEILRFPPEKDDTDLELALATVWDRGYRTIRVAAGLGGRLDQTWGNVVMLAQMRYAVGDVRLEDGRTQVSVIRRARQIQGQAGDTISLLPLDGPALGVVTSGLVYPLEAEDLDPHRTRGISNILAANSAEVRLEHGTLICIHTRRKN